MRKVLRKGGAVSVMVSLMMVGGIAFAAWTAQTTNNKAAGKFGSLAGVTGISAEAFATGDALPNGTATLTIRAHNGNAQAVTLTTVTTSGYTVTGNGGCSSPAMTLQSSYTLNANVPPGDSTITVPNGITVGASSNDCQSQTVTFDGLTFNTST